MRILITGGAGYIGSILTGHLLMAGHTVCVLDSFAHGENSLAWHCWNMGLRVVRGDARNFEYLKPFLQSADAIIPLAAIVGAPACNQDWLATMSTNVGHVKAICDALGKSGQMVILPNTNSGYGVGEEGKECTEETPLNPISLYGKSKMAAEKIVLEHGGVSLRLATVFGMSPRMRMDLLVNDFTWRAFTDKGIALFEPHFKRNYVHVRDVAFAFEHVLKSYEKMKGQAYNVGLSDANLSKIELCHVIQKYAPCEIFHTHGKDPDKRDYIVSNAKIEATGWKARLGLDFGIPELLKGYSGFQMPWRNA